MSLKEKYHKFLKIRKKIADYGLYVLYTRQFKRYLKLHRISNKPVDGEKEYTQKWKQLCKKVEPYSFRLFSHYMKPCADIVPENIGRSFIETKLNPESMRGYYEDKNMFPFICGKENVPKTVVCRINGGKLLDENLKLLDKPLPMYLYGHNRLILKPSVGSSSGRGIILFSLQDSGSWKSVDGKNLLDESFLMEYGNDFVLQVAVEQHPDMAYFCETSVNTLRLAVYRSWKDEQPHILASIMRVGKEGSFVDNAHAGGVYVGIDVKTGKVGDKLLDQYGNIKTEWNGVNYSKERFVPCWNEIEKLAKEISLKVKHHRLLAMDLTVNKDRKPMLIEYNLRGFSYWLFMFTNQKPLGGFTDEIIEFCREA